MTEQMAIEHAREYIKYLNHENWEKDFDAIQILINATEEIQQYRAIGTVEEIIAGLNDAVRTLEQSGVVIEVYMSKLEEYQSLGTVEELQALKEKEQQRIYAWLNDVRIDTIEEFLAEICKRYTEEERKGNYQHCCVNIKNDIAEIAESMKGE